INIAAKKENGKVSISISDTGIGIGKEDIPKIFDRFFHGDSTMQRVKSGVGLGLSIVQSIVKIHNGNIKVTSIPHKGSSFTVTLPLIQ
ncbi:MAG: HAMP domain-containing histidine kinase, partial [Candidatus Omnitrophica bacterium]|nr:HAMP domain-containing histidine kinase [Candidatus Omnitrophota bacterium]